MILKVCGILSFLFLTLSYFATDTVLKLLNDFERSTLHYFGYYYSLLGLFIFFLLIILCLSPFGKTKLGLNKPKISRFSWIAMLYSTGMGSGLLLRAVQEPLYYYVNPPSETFANLQVQSLKYTFYHWGFTPWAFYSLFGLLLAYYHYNEKREFVVSSIVSKKPANHRINQMLNTVSAIATLIGVVAALCLGGTQWVKGLEFFVSKSFTSIEVTFFILFIVVCSTLSAVSGVYKSIHRLSLLNIFIAFFLMFFVLLNSQPLSVVSLFFQTYFAYLYDFIPMNLNWGKHQTSPTFLMEWTYFYWAFWLAWTPFTALFIAKISEGRSVREFIICTLFIPCLGTFLWFSIFGNQIYNLMELKQFEPSHFSSIYDSLYLFLETLPFAPIIKTFAVINVFTFLITSLDSAILILSFHSEKKTSSNKMQNVLWGLLIGMISVGILTLGNANLLKIVSHLLIIMALPLSLLYSFSIFLFIKKILKKSVVKTI